MTIFLIRQKIKGAACDGILRVDGHYFCDCTENAHYRALPGVYDLTLRRVRGRTVICAVGPHLGRNPYITLGNGIYSATDARILLGTRLTPGCLTKSHHPLKLLKDRVWVALHRHHAVTLIIK